MKYIILAGPNGEVPVLFPREFMHRYVAQQFSSMQVVAAGFVRSTPHGLECYGVSSGLKIVSRGHIGLHQMKGSWAGAMGQCQFIPTSFLAYAVDGDGDGRADIWGNKADVFASIVNYLRAAGWRAGETWGGEVPAGTQSVAGGRIVRPAGPSGPAFATTQNFRAILRWNQSDFFALAVGLLSDRIAA